jgi:NAD(P)-dependent dehydrogenase (short-subunit alcohol dehydrogenase family)
VRTSIECICRRDRDSVRGKRGNAIIRPDKTQKVCAMGKVVALTGGATGIGAATAERLLAADCRVYVLDVAAPKAAHTAFIHCDLGRPDAIDAAIAELPRHIDGLVNVAGVPGPEPAVGVIAVNFLGLRHLTESLVPRIARGGSVVNVASTAGWDWQKRADVVKSLLDTPDFAAGLAWLAEHREDWIGNPYKFSKQCAAAYTHRASGFALRYGVRVNCVNPGATQTQLTPAFRELVGPAMYDWGVAQIGRHGTPADIAEVIEYLAIGACRWLNGAEIVVDGGYISGLTGGWVNLDASPNAQKPR